MASVPLTKDQEMAAHWKSQIEECDKATNNWHKRGDIILKHYRDDRPEGDKGVAKKFNLFWSNSKVKNPAVYSKAPQPICERRFLDKDPTGRVAATILERALRYEMPTSGFHKTLKRCRTDWSTVGRGQVWIRYNPKFGEAISPEQTGDNDIEINGKLVDEDREENIEAQQREVLSESLCVDYVHWKDFYIFPASARTWDEVEGVGRKILMSRQDCIDNFGEEIGKKIELDCKPKTDANEGGASTLSGKEGMQATTYEIWWKPTKKVYFIAQSYLELCKEAEDPLRLENFFPCPEPWSATMTNDSMIPVPDYAEAQDQYIQIDELSKRIDILTESCKVIGVYDASAQALKRVFQEAQEPNLIPVDSWAMFAEKGGLKSAIDWVPIEQIAKTLQVLIEVRAKIIEDLDRLTGINDIMRGTSDARETMGAQRLKTNGANIRIDDEREEAARFCRDIIAIMGELVAEHYDPQTLIQVSGAMYDEGLDPPDLPAPPPNPMMGHNGGPPLSPPPSPNPPAGAMPPQAPAQPPLGAPMPAGAPLPETPEQKQARKDKMIADAIMLLRNEKLRGFRIDIETDSTVNPDAEQEKEQRIAFVEGVTKFIETAGQVTATVPEFAPLAAKMLQFAVRGFRVGRDLESSIEDFCEKAEKKSKEAAANPKPDPEMMKAQAEIDRQRIENEGEQANNAANMQMKQLDVQIAQIKAQADIRSTELKAQQMEREDYYENRRHEREERKHAMEMERGDAEHKRAMELGERQHKQKMAAASSRNGASHHA